MLSIIATLSLALPVVQGAVTSQGHLQQVVFTLPQGKITIYLPDDIMPGDTISGTIIEEPAGQGDLFKSNEAVLEGLVLEVGGAAPKRTGRHAMWTIPAGVGGLATLSLSTPQGTQRGQASIPMLPPDIVHSPTEFGCDPVAASQSPMLISGPFDGDLANTQCSVGGGGLVPLAESPRSSVLGGTPSTTGPVHFKLNEAGQEATVACNLISVSLTASKTQLLRGETTRITMRVVGLEGVPPSEFPIPFELINQTPSNIRFEGVGGNVYAGGLPLSSVRNGQASIMTNVVALQPGGFKLRGVLFGVKMHDVKKLMDAKTFNAWVAGLIAAYEEKIKALEAELKKDPKNKGLQLNLQRKKNILTILKACRNSGNADLGVNKTLVDKALADDAFFKMAAELITTAAEMLGYTDIPMPGIGQILKGVKA
ncbi:MAG TPA: hypothetical protein VM328_08205, partial [Fimbriimonadaceae bacterium]|nr:hypothetical protein [Fimbriimonadaceae bacterium]